MKVLTRFSMLGLTITLSACGGGGSSSTGNTSTQTGIHSERFNNTKSYEFSSFYDSTFVEVKQMRLQKDIGYLRGIKLDRGESLVEYKTRVTPQGVYEPDTLQYPLGYRSVLVDYISADGKTIVLTPYNKAGHRDLKTTTEGEWVDLANQTVTAHTAVYWSIMAKKAGDSVFFRRDKIGARFKKFLALGDNSKFPAGAACFKENSSSNSIPHYTVYPGDTGFYLNSEKVQDFNVLVKNMGADAITGKGDGVAWVYSKSQANDSFYFVIKVGVQYNNTLYTAYWEKDPDKSVQKKIDSWEKQIAAGMSALDEISGYAAIEELKKECTSYNEVASNWVDKLLEESGR